MLDYQIIVTVYPQAITADSIFLCKNMAQCFYIFERFIFSELSQEIYLIQTLDYLVFRHIFLPFDDCNLLSPRRTHLSLQLLIYHYFIFISIVFVDTNVSYPCTGEIQLTCTLVCLSFKAERVVN